jgi:cytochrome c peroxidase
LQRLKAMRRILFLFIALFLQSGFRGDTPTPYHFPELKGFPAMPVAAGNPVTVEGADLGRHLFYDPVLSIDSTMSCASCHKQQSAFSDAPVQFSSGRNEILKRNTMALFNLAWYPSFFWDGRAVNIEDQVFHPLREKNEMNLDWNMAAERLNRNTYYRKKFRKAFGTSSIDSVMVSKAIAQFVRTLISCRSKYDRVLAGELYFSQEEYEGFILANEQQKGDCLHCHNTDANALGTQLQFSNNGLDHITDPEKFSDKGRGTVTGNIHDNGKFIIPSMRNLAFTAPYMHDGRFKTLEEVLDFYSEHVQQSANLDSKMEFVNRGGAHLTADEKKKIIAFLLTLSDSSFISDPAFSNPFK